MSGGRPPLGAGLVDGLDGSAGAKHRLKVFLETLSGRKAVGEASRELGIGEAAFYKARSQWLEDAVELLEPRRAGRPPKREEGVDAQVLLQLRSENEALRRALQIQVVREEIAVALPGLLDRVDRAREAEKKTR
jgi:transposase-like protein